MVTGNLCVKEEEEIIVDPLFNGLARPSMIFGVPFEWALGEVMVITLMTLWSDQFWILLMLAPVHLTGYLITLYNPRGTQHIMLWFRTYTRCLTQRTWGGSSFDPFPTMKQPSQIQTKRKYFNAAD